MKRHWYLVDVKDKILGRVATKIAHLLRGKGKVEYSPEKDCGDFVVVINAELVEVTGKKLTDKKYIHHTGYIGHLKELSLKAMLEKNPTQVIKKAVWGMLPKNKLRKKWILRLKIYKGEKHPHEAQKPQKIEV